MKRLRNSAKLGLLCWALCAPREVAAQTDRESIRETARQLGYAGARAQAAGDLAQAGDYFARAYRLMPVPTLGLAWARVLVSRGHLLEAQERLFEVYRAPVSESQAARDKLDLEVQRRAQADAEEESKALRVRIPTLALAVEGAASAELEVFLDDAPWVPPASGEGWRVDPGPHRVVVARDGERLVFDVDVAEAENEVIPVHLPAQGSQQMRDLQHLGLALGGTGVVALAVGGVLFAKYLGGEGKYQKACVQRSVSGSAVADCERRQGSVERDGSWAAGLGIGGGVLLATGATLFFLGGSERAEADPSAWRVGLDVGLGAVGAQVSGSF
jgi:hypothetical protein